VNSKLLLLIFLGSALGGMARYQISGWVGRRFGERFPVGTLIVNITGAFAIGVAWSASMHLPGVDRDLARSFLMVGVLGGFTTVSSFTWNTLTLIQAGEWRSAIFNVLGSFALCLAAVFAGAALGGQLQPRQ